MLFQATKAIVTARLAKGDDARELYHDPDQYLIDYELAEGFWCIASLGATSQSSFSTGGLGSCSQGQKVLRVCALYWTSIGPDPCRE